MNSVLTMPETLVRPEPAAAVLQKPTLNDIVRLSEIQNTPVVLDFEGGSLTSDAGILLLREVEQQLGLVKDLAAVINDPRDARYVKHSLMELMMQRIGQISSGYEDANTL